MPCSDLNDFQDCPRLNILKPGKNPSDVFSRRSISLLLVLSKVVGNLTWEGLNALLKI